MSELALASRKKCRICGHQLTLHSGVEAPTVQPSVEVRAAAPKSPAPQFPTQRTPAEEISHLAQLRESGQITDAEFEVLKARTISGE